MGRDILQLRGRLVPKAEADAAVAMPKAKIVKRWPKWNKCNNLQPGLLVLQFARLFG